MHFRIQEPRRNPSACWYSHKFNGPGLGWEIALSIHEQQLAWLSGPHMASKHDITIFREELEGEIPDGKLAIGDSGYRGSDKVAVSQEGDSDELRTVKNRARARQENFNERMKRFRILGETFKYDYTKLVHVVEAIAVLTQYDIEEGRPLNDVIV